MNWNQKDLICEFELLKEKIDDVITTHVWHGDEMFTKRDLTTKEEMMTYAIGYNESRIQHEHTTELMQVYLQRFDDLIKEFKALDIEKASSEESLATESDNA
ncbi:type II toxin-antitoxin system toxin TscT [Staphylococcus cohnii]|uniref:type II toxin-antitoxin system toxin TscT n=1 Tax=Staphylococcus cohnii TaxID=29382 RepID=UPI003D7C7F70